MRADTLKVKDVFSKDIRYVVPLFQRPYVWTKDDHWEPLWADVVAVAERLLSELAALGEDESVQAEEHTPPHFLGAVVVDQLKTVTADVEARHVIDGQQRLTTLQLLLDAVQATVAGLGDKRSARLLAKLVLNDEDVIKDADHIFKVWPTNVDQDAFRAVMDDEADPESYATNPIAQAHEYFGDAARAWIAELSDPEEQQRRMSALSTTLQGLLQLVVIDLEPHDNAQVIFETLNARGTPLLASDLVKNLLLHAAQQRGLDVQALYDTYWQEFDERDYWRAEVRQGRLVRPRIDVFLHYWLIMRSVEEVPSQEVFPIFRRHFSGTGNNSEACLADLARCGRVFRHLDDIPGNTPEGTFIYRWYVLDAQALTPLVLWLFDKPPDQVPLDERLRALRTIESWLVRRTICRLTTSGYNRLALDMIGELGRRPGRCAETIGNFLARQTAHAGVWPTDSQLIDAFVSIPAYSLLTRARARMILEALEDAHRSPKTEDEFVTRGRLTIEHVLPRAWHENWPLPTSDDGETGEEAAVRRDRTLHTFGNLTLVTKALNPALSNSGWATKRAGLAEHSVLHINKHFTVETIDTWDEGAIEARGRQLAAKAIEIWPGPAR